jgi:hypothetical protein
MNRPPPLRIVFVRFLKLYVLLLIGLVVFLTLAVNRGKQLPGILQTLYEQVAH